MARPKCQKNVKMQTSTPRLTLLTWALEQGSALWTKIILLMISFLEMWNITLAVPGKVVIIISFIRTRVQWTLLETKVVSCHSPTSQERYRVDTAGCHPETIIDTFCWNSWWNSFMVKFIECPPSIAPTVDTWHSHCSRVDMKMCNYALVLWTRCFINVDVLKCVRKVRDFPR